VRPEVLPLTVIVHVPSGVDADVSMMTAVVHVGEQDASVKVALAPGGSPDAVKGTIFVSPPVKVAAIGFDTDDPCATDRVPPFASAKLKGPAKALTTGPRAPRAASNRNVKRQIHLRRRARLNSRERTSPSKSYECCECRPAAGRGAGKEVRLYAGYPPAPPRSFPVGPPVRSPVRLDG